MYLRRFLASRRCVGAGLMSTPRSATRGPERQFSCATPPTASRLRLGRDQPINRIPTCKATHAVDMLPRRLGSGTLQPEIHRVLKPGSRADYCSQRHRDTKRLGKAVLLGSDPQAPASW